MRTEQIAPWRLVVPVKGRLSAKSRLHPPPGVTRSDLAHAIALDTLAAVAATIDTARLVVVTSDEQTATYAGSLGARVQPDPARGLIAAVYAGLAHVRSVLGPGPTAVLLGDLPALRPADLTAALLALQAHAAAFVPDADGTGSVLLAALDAVSVRPAFGVGSAAAHARHHVRLDLDLPRLRTDVDDDAGLRAAVALGVGRHTAAVLHAPTLA